MDTGFSPDGIYSTDELLGFCRSNGDLRVNQMVLYKAIKELDQKYKQLLCQMQGYTDYQVQVQKNKKDIAVLQQKQEVIISAINKLEDAVSCRFDKLCERVSKLEAKQGV